jgi:hypothetical protein
MTEPVTSVEPGCTCGGIAACAQCQDRDARVRARRCPTCNGRTWHSLTGRWVRQRETKGLVCERCGWDYGRDGEP